MRNTVRPEILDVSDSRHEFENKLVGIVDVSKDLLGVLSEVQDISLASLAGGELSNESSGDIEPDLEDGQGSVLALVVEDDAGRRQVGGD